MDAPARIPCLWRHPAALVLASGSAIRRDMLVAAGIPVEVRPASIDERAIEAQGHPGTGNDRLPPDRLALHLAKAKARQVSQALGEAKDTPGSPGSIRIVLGADQTLSLGDRILHKPASRQDAIDQIASLSGRRHELHAAMALAVEGEIVASHVATASLTMRALSPAFIEAYVASAMPDILSSVGAYQLERLGIHLFERIDGDHFTILGLPLLAVLRALRERGALAT